MKRVLLLTVLAALLLNSCGAISKREDAEVTIDSYTRITYQTVEVERGSFVPVIDLKLKSDSYIKRSYSLNREGMEVDQVFVSVGQKVQKGELLISCKSNDVEDKIEVYETRIQRNQILYDHLVSLNSIEESDSNKVTAEQVARAIEIDRLRISELHARLGSYDISAEADGIVVDIADGLKQSTVGKTKDIVTVIYGDGMFYASTKQDIKLDPDSIYAAYYDSSEYWVKYLGRAEEDGKNKYSFKVITEDNEFCTRESLDLRIEEESLDHVLYVPEDCIIKVDNKNYVYLLDENGFREAREVEVLTVLDGKAIIGSGLVDTDEVVINEKEE